MSANEHETNQNNATEPQKRPKYVLVADVNRIKEYLFASVRLRQIVNASALLSDVNKRQTEDLILRGKVEIAGQKKQIRRDPNAELIFSDGGVTQALFQDEAAAKECARTLEELYPSQTQTATVVAHVEKWKEGESFVEVMRRALRTVRQKKDGIVYDGDSQPLFQPLPSPGGSPFFRFCAQTAREYAIRWEPREPTEADRDAADQDVRTREEFGPGSWIQHDWEPDPDMRVILTDFAHTDQHPKGCEVCFNSKQGDRLPVDVLLRYRLAHELGCDPNRFQYTADLEKLVRGASPRNYLGFMDADGNGFGDFLSELRKKEADDKDYAAFSRVLTRTTQQAFVELAAEVLSCYLCEQLKRGGKVTIPLRVLMLGGDDVLVIGLPQHMLDLADRFCRQFQKIADVNKESCGRDKVKELPPFTMSAGVVITHHNFPFLSLQKLGGALLKSAKRRAWVERCGKTDQRRYGSVDFQVITASGADDLKELRKASYTLPNEPKLSLTARPYLVGLNGKHEEFSELLRTVRTLKEAGVSRRQIKALNDLLRRGRQKGHLDFLLWLSRLRQSNKVAADALEDYLKTQCLSPWLSDTRKGHQCGFYTPLLDIVELFDILKPSDTGR